MTRVGPVTARLAAVLELTMPGVPSIFAGTEIGARYDPYRVRGPLRWRDRAGAVVSYVRAATADGDRPVVLLNWGSAAGVRLSRDERRMVTDSGVTRELLSGKRIDVRRTAGRLTLRGGEALILTAPSTGYSQPASARANARRRVC